jgi:DNA-binding MarR family transcriptional regulator
VTEAISAANSDAKGEAKSDVSGEMTPGRRLLIALMTFGRRLRPRAAQGGLDQASVFVLHHVLAKGPLRLTELAKCLRLDGSTVSRHVKNLEDSGYLHRSPDPLDRRAARVQVTEQGRALLNQAMDAKIELLDKAIADWPERDREALTTLLLRLAERIDQMTAETECD